MAGVVEICRNWEHILKYLFAACWCFGWDLCVVLGENFKLFKQMKNAATAQKIVLLFSIILLSSCVVNLRFRPIRPIDIIAEDQLSMESHLFLKNLPTEIDTLLIIKTRPYNQQEERYIIHIYKEDGVTKIKVIGNHAYYPIIDTVKGFEWGILFSSKEPILNQKPKFSEWTTSIDNDTIKNKDRVSYASENNMFEFRLISKEGILYWTTTALEGYINPSIEKYAVFMYVMNATYSPTWKYMNKPGRRKYRSKPIIGKKNKDK